MVETRGIARVTQKLISKGGMSLWIPEHMTDTPNASPRITDVDIYAQTPNKLYPLGSSLEFGDGRLSRYGKFGATSTSAPIARLVVNANACPSADGFVGDDGFEGNLVIAGAVGDKYVDLWTILGASGTGYRTAANPFAKDFFEDGMLAVYPSGHYVEYRICGSDKTVTPNTRLYLDAPLKTALVVGTAGAYVTTGTLTGSTGGSGVTAYPSLYSQAKDGGAEGVAYVSALGVCLASGFTSDYYGWIQRRGRCIITPTAYFGDTANERMAQLHSDGTIALKAAYGTHTIGYLTQRTVSGYGDLEVWLTLE